MPYCQLCGIPLSGKQEKFCSRGHKDSWWNEKRKAEIKGFESLRSALQKAGYEIRRMSIENE